MLAGIHTTLLAVLHLMHKAEALNLPESEEERLHEIYHNLRSEGLAIAKHFDQARAFFALVD